MKAQGLRVFANNHNINFKALTTSRWAPNDEGTNHLPSTARTNKGLNNSFAKAIRPAPKPTLPMPVQQVLI